MINESFNKCNYLRDGDDIMFNKAVNLLMFEGDPNGLVMCELSNWTGRLYRISRTKLAEFSNRDDSNYTGIYFLFGKNALDENTVYIGEAEKVYDRLKQHLKDKLDWNEVIVVISKDNNLNKAHIKLLENYFYNKALDVKRFKINNTTVPTRSSVSIYDEAMLEEFIENTTLLVNLLDKKVFDPILKNDISKTKQDKLQIIAARGAHAEGLLTNDGFVVLAGSKIAVDTTKSMPQSLKNLRSRLIEEKNIIDNTFVDNYLFTSPSLAAAVVMGRSANGRTEWKNTSGKSIAQIEKEGLEIE